MDKCKVVLNSSGIREILRSGEMLDILSGHASTIAARTGGEAEGYIAGTRAVAEVRGKNENNSLLKGMRG